MLGLPVSGWTSTRYTDNCSTVCPPDALGVVIFAGVVRDTAVAAAERLPSRIRATLGIHLFGVAENGEMDAFHAVRVCAR
jgi:hypothetical protein